MKSEANPQQTGHACASDQCQHQLSIPIDCTGAPAHDCADGPGYSLAIRDSRGPLNGHPSLRHGVARPRAAWRCLMLVATTQWLSRGECWELAGPLNSRVEQTPTRICQSHTNLEQHREASNRSRAMSSAVACPPSSCRVIRHRQIVFGPAVLPLRTRRPTGQASSAEEP